VRKSIVFSLVVFFLGWTPVALAANSTVACHCFKDRSYDHQKPQKVVPYLLATTQNSFLAVSFKVSKFNLVKDLMGGVPSDQLWISHYFADRFETDSKSLLRARSNNSSWRAALKTAGFDQNRLPARLIEALKIEGDDQSLAEVVVDETLQAVLRADTDQLSSLRSAGAKNRETILTFFLAGRTGQKPTAIYRSVVNGLTSWGTLAFVNNVQIGKMEQEFRALLGVGD
jgi:hypothetical protein